MNTRPILELAFGMLAIAGGWASWHIGRELWFLYQLERRHSI